MDVKSVMVINRKEVEKKFDAEKFEGRARLFFVETHRRLGHGDVSATWPEIPQRKKAWRAAVVAASSGSDARGIYEFVRTEMADRPARWDEESEYVKRAWTVAEEVVRDKQRSGL